MTTALLGILALFEVGRTTIAESLGASNKLEKIARAAAMVPRNPEFQYRLGVAYQWQEINSAEAVGHLRRAVEINPNHANYWLALGQVCFTAGDRGCADEAFEHTIRLAPNVPGYRWEIANYYLVIGRRDDALAHFRRYLELHSEDPLPTFRLCLRSFENPRSIWEALLYGIDNPRLKLAFIKLLTEGGQADIAYQLWNEFAGSDARLSFATAQPYLERLISEGQFEKATGVWRDLERFKAIHRPASDDLRNSIFNGGFEQEPLDAGFDWRSQDQRGLTLDFAEAASYGGNRCLRIDFTVAQNGEYEPVYQIVPVEPKQQYRLTAFARSEGITSDSGPRMRVVDLGCPSCAAAESEETKGTTPWHQVSVNFVTGEHTQAIRISVWRPRSRSFPMDIQGQFWLDAVELKTNQQ